MSSRSRLFAASLAPVIALVLALPLSLLPPASARGTATISGTVTGPDGGGLRGIEVTVYKVGPQDWVPVKSTRSDGAGRYQLTGLAASRAYQLGFTETAGDYVAEYLGDATTLNTASTSFPVTKGATVSGMDARLALAGHVRGTVTGLDGAALDDVYVNAFQRSRGSSEWHPVMGAVADASGAYEVDGLAAGRCRLQFAYDHVAMPGPDLEYLPEYYDNAATVETATDVTVTAGATTTVKGVELAKGGHIIGTVTGAAGVALAGITVTAYRWDDSNGWAPVSYTQTGEDGAYDLSSGPNYDSTTAMRAGTYRVGFEDNTGAGYVDAFYGDVLRVEQGTDISVAAGTATSGMNAELTSTATPSLTPTPTATPALTATARPASSSTPTRLPVAVLVGTMLAATIGAIGIIGLIAIRRRARGAEESQSGRPSR